MTVGVLVVTLILGSRIMCVNSWQMSSLLPALQSEAGDREGAGRSSTNGAEFSSGVPATMCLCSG